MKKLLLLLLCAPLLFSCGESENSITGENISKKDQLETEENLKNGQGYLNLYHDNYLYVGEIKDGKPHGRGTLRHSVLSDFDTLKLIKEGKIEYSFLREIEHNETDIMLKYVGDWVNGVRNGYGIEYYSDGMWWDGEFKNNSFCTTCEGNVKFGSFFDSYVSFFTNIDGKKTNEIYRPGIRSDIDFREGDCEGDCDFGFGTLKYYNGSLYVGNFKNSERNGSGKFTNLMGEYIGEYKNDLFHGEGIYTWINGDKYVGEFKNGLENGYGEKTYKSGKFEKGLFKNGKLSE